MESQLVPLKVPEEIQGGGDAVVLEWHVREGEAVAEGKALVDLVTEAGLHSVAAAHRGRIREILVDEGTRVDVGETLAFLVRPRPTGGLD